MSGLQFPNRTYLLTAFKDYVKNIRTTLVGKPPYESKDVKSTYQRILANKYEFPDSIPITNNAKDLISAMLQTNPQKRWVFPARLFL